MVQAIKDHRCGSMGQLGYPVSSCPMRRSSMTAPSTHPQNLLCSAFPWQMAVLPGFHRPAARLRLRAFLMANVGHVWYHPLYRMPHDACAAAAEPLDTTMVYDLASNTWTTLSARLHTARSDCCTAAVGGRLYTAGAPVP